jgi:hypothetical protein
MNLYFLNLIKESTLKRRKKTRANFFDVYGEFSKERFPQVEDGDLIFEGDACYVFFKSIPGGGLVMTPEISKNFNPEYWGQIMFSLSFDVIQEIKSLSFHYKSHIGSDVTFLSNKKIKLGKKRYWVKIKHRCKDNLIKAIVDIDVCHCFQVRGNIISCA